MSELGELPQRPDLAIFADTGWEPPSVYANIRWLGSQLSYPIVTVAADPKRSLRDAVLQGVNVRGRPWLTIPVWLADPDGNPGGMNWRQCTTDYKIVPIRAEVRRRLGLKRRSPIPDATSVEMWLGITIDESTRMRMSPDKWIMNRYPLIDAGLTRTDCVTWFSERYPGGRLPRSACIGCPYRSAHGWVEMMEEDPASFADAIVIDTELRSSAHHASRMFRNKVFLHSRRIPLAEAVAADAAAVPEHDGAWGNECAGVCGV